MGSDHNSAELQDDGALSQRTAEQVFEQARSIPAGHVISYGALGALCDPPISGYVCGRIMGRVAPDVPWWRIVGKNGRLPIRKRNPNLGVEQRERLEAEGIVFDEDGGIPMARYEWRPNALF
jgi:methylated-DNA-protein-cysteine methyltransferase-like protein